MVGPATPLRSTTGTLSFISTTSTITIQLELDPPLSVTDKLICRGLLDGSLATFVKVIVRRISCCVCVCMYVCMYVGMYVCACVCRW